MENKLQALKVPELKALLQKASLPVSGNKADLVSRLLANPTATTSLSATSEEEEEEDLLAFDESKPTESKAVPSAAPSAAPAAADATAPTPVAQVTAAEVPKEAESTPTPVTTKQADPSSTEVPKSEPSSTELTKAALEELGKRIKRAEKFSLPMETIQELQNQKNRIEKFGVTEAQLIQLGLKQSSTPIGKQENKNQSKKAKSSLEQEKKKLKPSPSVQKESEEEKKLRLERQAAEEVARKRRAERFGLTTNEDSNKKQKLD